MMAEKRVIDKLDKAGKKYVLKEFECNFKDSKHAAELIGIELCYIAKCLVFRLPIGIVVIILAGDVRLDAGKYKKKFKVKPYRLDEADLLEYTGYVPGAVTPIALTYHKAKVFMDVSLKPYINDYIYPSGGTLNSAVEIKTSDLFEVCGCKEWIDIAECLEK